MRVLYGLDFGTTNSSIGIFRHDAITGNRIVELLPVDHSNVPTTLMPSLACLTDSGEVAVGAVARRLGDDPRNVFIRSIKLELDKEVYYEAAGQRYTPRDITAHILRQLRERAFNALFATDRERATGVVVGVPVGWDDLTKESLQIACEEAGFVDEDSAHDGLRFVAEPVAVALGYSLQLQRDERVLVFDFGGGTLDLTIMDMRRVRIDALEPHAVIAKHGIPRGGNDIDLALLTEIVRRYGEERFLAETGLSSLRADELSNVGIGTLLLEAVENHKKQLSEHSLVEFDLRVGATGVAASLTEQEYEALLQPLLAEVREAIREVLKRGNMTAADIDQVLMAGGSSLVPAVWRLVQGVFGTDKVSRHDPLTAIARGLTTAGGLLQFGETHSDITDVGYGVWDSVARDVSVIIERGTPYSRAVPRRGRPGVKRTYTAVRDDQTHINVKIYRVDGGSSRVMHTIRIPIKPGRATGERFDVYFSIDRNKGWLQVKVFDNLTAEWIQPAEQSRIRLS